MVATGGRVVALTPANAAHRHRRSAISGHVAAARGRRLRDVGHLGCRHRGRGHVAGGEAHLAAISRALAVDGVGSYIIFRVGSQAGYVHREAARSRAAAGVATARRRNVACAPADAALGHRRAAVSGHVAAARGRRLRDVRHLGCRHCGRGHVLAGGKAHLRAVGCALAVDGVCADVIGRVRCQAGHVRRERTRPRTAAGVAAVSGRIVACAPANAACSNLKSAVVGNIAATCCRCCRYIGYIIGCHCWHSILSGYLTLQTIGCPLTCSGISPHIIFSINRKLCDIACKLPRSGAVSRMAVACRRVVARTPANAACSDIQSTVVGNIAAAHRRCCRYIGYIIGRNRWHGVIIGGENFRVCFYYINAIGILINVIVPGVGLQITECNNKNIVSNIGCKLFSSGHVAACAHVSVNIFKFYRICVACRNGCRSSAFHNVLRINLQFVNLQLVFFAGKQGCYNK